MTNNSRKAKKIKPNNLTSTPKERSMGRLIVWNVTKAMEKNPQLNLRDALRETSFKLENKMTNVNLGTKQESSEERYLACAVLAWQQLGHSSADSLCSFVESKKPPRSSSDELMCQASKQKCEKRKVQETPYNYDRGILCGEICKPNIDVSLTGSESFIAKNKENKPPESLPPAAVTEVSKKGFGCARADCYAGPVVRLPTTCVMRVETTSAPLSMKTNEEMDDEPDVPVDVEMVGGTPCCLQPTCMDRLRELDAMTQELRERSAKLAKREAERVELLERAESSWRNVEQGYQRRLKLAEDGELDLLKQVKYGIDERNGYKNQCTQMASSLRESAEYVEKMRTTLKELDQQLCDRASKRMHLSQELTKLSTTLSDAHSKAWQLDRELQFKEEQAQRKLATMESEINSARALTIETERALRSQLNTLRSQINSISKQLLSEDERYKEAAKVVEDLENEKAKLVISLEKCKLKCDCNIQEAEALLKQKTEEFKEISAKVPTCLCQNPVDACVTAKRTPSLAAMCACDPELGMSDECSCQLMPNTLLSNMLSGLFSGLRDELATIGINMPCPLLKCLDDRHSWETATPAKAAVKSFFTNLLVGELEVAITTSIEKHHARWVGTTCADEKAVGTEPKDWHDKVIEKKAQKLATKLAEQLFNEKADKLAEKAQELIKAAPHCTCDCPDDKDKSGPAIYSCLVHAPPKMQAHPRDALKETGIKQKAKENVTSSRLWKQTQQDVTELKAQVESLRKAAINKGDLKHIEEKITRAVKYVTAANGKPNHSLPLKESARATNTEHKRVSDIDKKLRKHMMDSGGTSKRQLPGISRKHPQAYAVNLCFCEPDQDPKKILSGKCRPSGENQKQSNWKQKASNRIVRPLDLSTQEEFYENDVQKKDCVKCNCFNREPSNTSIDKLLDTLAKWKGKLTHEESIERVISGTPKTTLNKLGIPKELLAPYINKDETNNQETKKSKPCGSKMVDSVRLSCKGKYPLKSSDLVPPDNNNLNTTESELISSINLEKSNEADIVSKNTDGQFSKESAQKNTYIQYDVNLSVTKGTQPSEILKQQATDESVQISNSINGKTTNCSDYEIKLLGVTLTECDTQRILKEKYKKKDDYDPYFKNEKDTSKENSKNYEEKSLEVPSIEVTNKTTECICCRETTEDLEINTFSLIEEYLKKRLEEYKDSSCISKCLTKDEENKLFSDMLRNIKTTISQTVKNTKCLSCTGSKDENDNFKRGYCLLQEYLKLKLKRIQCVCPDKMEKEYLVADIYEKICSQIENDFQRLKNVYSCNKNNINFEQPEKDTNGKESNLQRENACNTSKIDEFPISKDEDATEINNKSVNVPSVKSHISSQNNTFEESVELMKDTLPKQNKIDSNKSVIRGNLAGGIDVPSEEKQINYPIFNTCNCTASAGTSKSNSLFTGTSSMNIVLSRKELTFGQTETSNIEDVNKNMITENSHTHSERNKEIKNNVNTTRTSEYTNENIDTTRNKNNAMSPTQVIPPAKTMDQVSYESTYSLNSETEINEYEENEKEQQENFKDPDMEYITICTCSEKTERCTCDQSCGCHRKNDNVNGECEVNNNKEFKNLQNMTVIPEPPVIDNYCSCNNMSVVPEPPVIDNYCSCNMPSNYTNFIHKESNNVENNAWAFQVCNGQPQLLGLYQSLQASIHAANMKNDLKKTTPIPIPPGNYNADEKQEHNNTFIIPEVKPIIESNSLSYLTKDDISQVQTKTIDETGIKITTERASINKDIGAELQSKIATPYTGLTIDSCRCGDENYQEINPQGNIVYGILPGTNYSNILVNQKVDIEIGENKPMDDPESKEPTSPYIGYTMDCSSKLYGGPCSCYQSLPAGVNDTVQNMWLNSLNDTAQLSKFAYIMEKVKNCDLNLNDCTYSETDDTTDNENIEASKVQFQEAQINTAQTNDDIMLKISDKSLPETSVTKTDCDDVFTDNWYECCSNRSRKISDTFEDFFEENNRKLLGQYKTQSVGTPSTPCNCGMVPVCHVKLLMKSLETKLDSGKCTCDALKCSVCPIHSMKN